MDTQKVSPPVWLLGAPQILIIPLPQENPHASSLPGLSEAAPPSPQKAPQVLSMPSHTTMWSRAVCQKGRRGKAAANLEGSKEAGERSDFTLPGSALKKTKGRVARQHLVLRKHTLE